MRRYIGFILILISSWAHGQSGNSPSFALSGDVALLSHYVEYGLSQSDKSPALQGSFWFNFGPQFRLGAFASNTNYENSDDHFNLRGNAEIQVDFSSENKMIITYSQSQYYKDGDRNGDILGLHLHFGEYRILYDTLSNWEGTHERSPRFALGAEFSVFSDWLLDIEAGYNAPDISTLDPYFDLRMGLGSKFGSIFLEGSVTGTSASSELNGAGDVFFILSAKTELK
ncbi:putative bacterial protein [compost metagenome]